MPTLVLVWRKGFSCRLIGQTRTGSAGLQPTCNRPSHISAQPLFRLLQCGRPMRRLFRPDQTRRTASAICRLQICSRWRTEAMSGQGRWRSCSWPLLMNGILRCMAQFQRHLATRAQPISCAYAHRMMQRVSKYLSMAKPAAPSLRDSILRLQRP